MKSTLVTLHKDKLEEFRDMLSDTDIEVTAEKILGMEWRSLATPGNSVGWMKGGFDDAILRHFGKHVEVEVRNHAPIAVGNSCTVEIGDKKQRLIYAPTMEYPKDIRGTANVFWAYLEVFRWEDDVVFPLFGTGIGKMSDREAIAQLVAAWKVHNGEMSIDSFVEMKEFIND